MYIFSMENPFFRFVGKLVDLFWINILTLVCCLPIFTAGASFCAMYRLLLMMVNGTGGGITRAFFKEFKRSFKSATLVWIPSFVGFVILFLNAYLLKEGVLDEMGYLFTIVGVVIAALILVLAVFLEYYFALSSWYENSTKAISKNALYLMIAFLPRTLCTIAIWVSPIALMMLSDYFLWFWFVYGFSFPGFVVALLMRDIFAKTEEKVEYGQR